MPQQFEHFVSTNSVLIESNEKVMIVVAEIKTVIMKDNSNNIDYDSCNTITNASIEEILICSVCSTSKSIKSRVSIINLKQNQPYRPQVYMADFIGLNYILFMTFKSIST